MYVCYLKLICYGIIVNQELTAECDSMIVGLRNFHERREAVPDSNFWCTCPVSSGFCHFNSQEN